MIPIPTEAVAQLARIVVTSQIAQAAAGTVLGLCIYSGAAAAGQRIGPKIGAVWRTFRTAPPIIEAKPSPAAS
jgi:hypothetical protein